jgi:drug/metabolite transporter, DME family
MISSTAWCRMAVLGAAILFSTGGAGIKAITLTNWQIACFRSLIAAITLLVLVPETRRNWTWRVWPAGVAYAATLITFVTANKLTTSANAIFLQSTGPFYLLLLSPWLLKERIHRRDLVVMVVIAVGMGLVLFAGQPQSATAPDPWLGNIVGVFTGIAWAFTIATLRWLGSDRPDGGSAMAAVVVGNLLACLMTLSPALPLNSWISTDVWILGYLGVFQVGLAYFFLVYAVKHLSAMETSLLILAEPALNPVWTLAIHNERPAGWAILGGSLILMATLFNLFRRP